MAHFGIPFRSDVLKRSWVYTVINILRIVTITYTNYEGKFTQLNLFRTYMEKQTKKTSVCG